MFRPGSKLLIYSLSFSLIALVISEVVYGQQVDRIKLERADYLENGVQGDKRFDKVIGNVMFSQKDTRIYGDSAFFFKQENLVEIFGRVRVLEGDSITITGGKLIYQGDQKLAQMRKNVVYRDPSMTLNTDFLDYDMIEHMAYYFQKGRLVTKNNTLTSKKGYYDTEVRYASFKDSVRIRNVDGLVEADTIQFNTVTEVAYFLGPTVITSNNGTILHADEGGIYRTREDISNFSGAAIETTTYLLHGDELYADRTKEYYTATHNVSLIGKEDDVIINGDYGKYWKEQGVTKIYGNTLMKKIFPEGDTLYISADTLISIEDSIPSNERLLAFNNVLIFKPNLQGKSDSLSYHLSDSLIYMYDDPVLWSDKSQMESDTISMITSGGQIDRMFLNTNAFVTSLTVDQYYDQVKGRNMTAYFKEGKLSQVDVNGNGESIYFEIGEKDSLVMGMNKIVCSDMRLRFKEQKISDITFYSPDGSFIPFHEINPESTKLENFSWRSYERPTRYSVLGDEMPGNTADEKVKKQLPDRIKPIEADAAKPTVKDLNRLQKVN